ncbi:MAG TPA: cyclase family protein [bacterium]|nr:cyclase family protein [bacterium]
MKIYDVTLSLRDGMPTYPGDPPFSRRTAATIEEGASSEVGIIETGAHAGTHIDAPAHMMKGGGRLESIRPEALIGPARVFDMRRIKGHIDARHLEALNWRGVKRVLFRTKNSARHAKAKAFDPGFVALTGDAAEFLASKRLLLVGVDGPSVDRFRSGTHPAHMPLLGAGVVLLEGLDLSRVPAGTYNLFCGPIKIEGGEGAPARVFLTRGRI